MANALQFSPVWVRDLDIVFSYWLMLLVVLIGQCIAYDMLLLVLQFSLYPQLDLLTYALYFVPRYGVAILVLTLVWLWRNKALVVGCWQAQHQSTAPTLSLVTPIKTEATQQSVPVTQAPPGIIAFKGRDKAFIRLADIEGVIAARNYLDIYSAQGEYIVRDTMKNMEALLAGQDFVRTHRSALVRMSAVRRFKRLTSGNGLALLASGTGIPVNKNFMSALGKSCKDLMPVKDGLDSSEINTPENWANHHVKQAQNL